MTNLEMRALLSALELEYKTKRAAIVATYNNQDRTAANAARAAHAREARVTYRLDGVAASMLNLFDTNPLAFRNGTLSGSGTPADCAAAARACELSDGRLAFRQLSPTTYEVTQIVTL